MGGMTPHTLCTCFINFVLIRFKNTGYLETSFSIYYPGNI